ncbi:hypothetical protein RD792_017920 [Penstemon davidsonii]|uniref:Uncharacterized protein n=1 Tax=Penstemon davidsonii TaxID=160366 RepID=A0ABR0DWJ2_9LAMI|nr:hypothetical protein RD792_017920 [Penstemon davidsonii]
MTAEPLLLPPQLHDFSIKIQPSSNIHSFHPVPPHHPSHIGDFNDGYEEDDDDDEAHDLPSTSPSSSSHWARKRMQRCRTAPARAAMTVDHTTSTTTTKPTLLSSSSLVRQASLLLVIYLSLGVVAYSFNRDHFSLGIETHPAVDALYFCIVTMCTIGYGDIAPSSPPAKFFACVFVLVGFGFIDILLSGVVNYVLDLQENNMILIQTHQKQKQKQQHKELLDYIVDAGKGRMRIRIKVGLALGVVVMCIGIGALVLCFVERLDWVDSLYLSVMSVTTVGYGDTAFKTLQGRLFASVWLLLSTLAVARAFLYLAEARIDKRHRKIANWVLHRDITVQDLFAADVNNNGFISKSEYIIYKLKEMEKITEKDIMQICDQFNKLDRNNSGKISLIDLLENHL